PTSKWWQNVKDVITKEQVETAYNESMQSMARLNRNAAALMHKYGARGATDVTGFGILGHADNLVKVQNKEVSFVIHTLPIFANMAAVYKACGINFKLLDGYSAETSGGLLVILPSDKAEEYCSEILKLDGQPSWIIGEVVPGPRNARLSDDLKVIDV
ncbi:hypothetical protein QZH41_017682, partial [Actinostola sp. cb2023]